MWKGACILWNWAWISEKDRNQGASICWIGFLENIFSKVAVDVCIHELAWWSLDSYFISDPQGASFVSNRKKQLHKKIKK